MEVIEISITDSTCLHVRHIWRLMHRSQKSVTTSLQIAYKFILGRSSGDGLSCGINEKKSN